LKISRNKTQKEYLEGLKINKYYKTFKPTISGDTDYLINMDELHFQDTHGLKYFKELVETAQKMCA